MAAWRFLLMTYLGHWGLYHLLRWSVDRNNLNRKQADLLIYNILLRKNVVCLQNTKLAYLKLASI